MSQAPPAVLLEHYLKTLRLPTMQREHAKLAAVCQAERADYATYLLRLVYNTRILTLPIAKQNMSARFRLPIRPPRRRSENNLKISARTDPGEA